MKSAFSLLELIFTIVIMGIVAFFAVPKFMNTKDSALVSTIKRDVNTAVNAIQSYYLLNQKIDDIKNALNISNDNWTTVEPLKLIDKNDCLSIEVDTKSKKIKLDVSATKESEICEKFREAGLETKEYELQ